MTHKPPTAVGGTPVTAWTDRPLKSGGEVWVTLVPDEEDDERLWEWSLTTGRLIEVSSG